MKRLKNIVENTIEKEKAENLSELIKKRDLLKIVGGSEEEIKEIESKILEIKNEKKVEEEIHKPKLSIEQKMSNMSNMIVCLSQKKESITKQIDSLLKKDLTDAKVKEEIIDKNNTTKKIEKDLNVVKDNYKVLKSLNNEIVSLQTELHDVVEHIDQLYQQFQLAKICREDRIPIENCIRESYQKKQQLEKAINNCINEAEEIEIPDVAIDNIVNVEEEEKSSEKLQKFNISSWIEQHNIWIAIFIFIALLVTVIVIFNACKGMKSSNGDVEETSTSVNTTYVTTSTMPTTVTTVPVTKTSKPKKVNKKTKKTKTTTTPVYSGDSTNVNDSGTGSYYSSGTGKGGSSSSYYESYTPKKKKTYKTYDKKKDMSSKKDSKKDEGKTGGNKGYKATISNKKESPVPEKIFDKEHPLPSKVTKKEISTAPTVKLTPKAQSTTVANSSANDNIFPTVTNTVDNTSE